MARSRSRDREVSELRAALEASQALVKKLSTTSRNHEFGVADPASHYTQELVEINNPFVSFYRKSPAADKFKKRRLPDSILRYALNKVLLRPVVAMELPWHLSLLQGYRSLSKASSEAVARVHSFEVDAGILPENESDEVEEEEEEVELEEALPRAGDEPNDEDMTVDDLDGEAEDEEDYQEEEDDEEEEEGGTRSTGSHRQGFCIKALDTLVFKRRGDAWVTTVLVIESEEPLKPNGLWQAVRYAIREGLVNVSKGRVAPIHVMQWSSTRWSYGVVDVFGSLRIERGEIVAGSHTELEKQQRVKWMYGGKKGSFKLDERLSLPTLRIRSNCSSIKDIDPPDGTYLVARIFIDPLIRDLPNSVNLGRIGAVDCNKFYEGLLKIIVGSKAEEWTKEDVDAAIAAREDEEARILRAATSYLNKRQTATKKCRRGKSSAPNHLSKRQRVCNVEY